jgi:hypothetical protein
VKLVIWYDGYEAMGELNFSDADPLHVCGLVTDSTAEMETGVAVSSGGCGGERVQ